MGVRTSLTLTNWPNGTPRMVVASVVLRSSLAVPKNRTRIGVRRSVSRKSPERTPPSPPDSALATWVEVTFNRAICDRSSVTSMVGWVLA